MVNILFIHGFGKKTNRLKFYSNANAFIENDENLYKFFDIKPYEWDSQEYVVNNAGYKFGCAKKVAENEHEGFSQKINKLEEDGNPYYVIAQSLGCYLFCSFLNKTNIKSKKCAGIFFIGAAVPKDISLDISFLRNSLKIINYYSPKSDKILSNLYFNKEGTHAGGEVGFSSNPFINYRCSATHAYKPGPFHSDWSQLARPIIEMIAYNEGKQVSGNLKFNVKWPVNQGNDWWNNILEINEFAFDKEKKNIFIQQQKFEGHYRLVSCSCDTGKRYREGHSKYLSPILEELSKNHDDVKKYWPLQKIELG